MRVLISIIFFLSYLFIFFSYAETQEKFYTVENVDGVEVVHNHKPLWRDKKKIELKLQLTIGSINSMDDNYIFSYIKDANIDKNGNYYIVDIRGDCIKKYDTQGNILTTIGRRGQGPGEFNSPSHLSFDNRNNLIVYERRSRRVQQIAFENKKSIRINYDIKYINEIKTLKSGLFAISTFTFDASASDDSSRNRILLTDHNFAIKNSFLRYNSFNKVRNEKRKGLGFFLMNECFLGIDSEENIFVAEKHENKIEKYTGEGRLLIRFDRDLPYEIKMYLGKEFSSLWLTQTMLQVEVDQKNRVWIP